jgi:hypothetical protein
MKVKIIPFKTSVEGIFAELPEDVLFDNIWMNEFYPHFLQFYLTGETFYDRVRLIDFEDAHYEPVNFARDMSELECTRIVSRHPNDKYFQNYKHLNDVGYGYEDPMLSFRSLMASVDADQSKHWLVLIKKYNK